MFQIFLEKVAICRVIPIQQNAYLEYTYPVIKYLTLTEKL